MSGRFCRVLTLTNHCTQIGDGIRLIRGLVPAQARDTREAHGDAGFVPLGFVHRVKCHLKHQRFFDFAHRAKTRNRVVAHEAIKPLQFFIAEP